MAQAGRPRLLLLLCALLECKSSFYPSPSPASSAHRCFPFQPRCRAASSAAFSSALAKYGDVPNDFASTSDDSWMPSSLVTTAAPDPFKVAHRVAPLVLLHVLWSCVLTCVRLSVSRWCWPSSALLHSLLGGTLGLLLAFRTNQAWSRYWSACAAWATVHKACHNLARLSSELSYTNTRLYSTFMRHLIALPIALKQRLRRDADPAELYKVLSRPELAALLRSPSPHLMLLSSLSTLVRPLRARDDGGGKGLALWGELERGLNELQGAVASLDLVARVPPPASYSTFTARFLLLFTATLPLVLLDVLHPIAVPITMAPTAWALYSTEELAKILDEPFGQPSAARCATGATADGGDGADETELPETVPVEMYVDQIVSELQHQVAIERILATRVDQGEWAVTREALELRRYDTTASDDHAPTPTDAYDIPDLPADGDDE